jgi:hypothetical protein
VKSEIEKGAEILGSNEMMLEGLPALNYEIFVRADHSRPSYAMRLHSVITIRERGLFQVIFEAPEDEFGVYREVFDKILASLKLF